MNSVSIAGRLTKDIELRNTQNGSQTASFTLAVNRSFKKEGQPDADFINCVAFGKTAELLGTYCQKGSQVGVEGRIQTRSYENQQGQRVYLTEVVANSITFLDSKADREQRNTAQNMYQNNQRFQYQQNYQPNPYQQPQRYGSFEPDGAPEIEIDDSDLPF